MKKVIFALMLLCIGFEAQSACSLKNLNGTWQAFEILSTSVGECLFSINNGHISNITKCQYSSKTTDYPSYDIESGTISIDSSCTVHIVINEFENEFELATEVFGQLNKNKNQIVGIAKSTSNGVRVSVSRYDLIKR